LARKEGYKGIELDVDKDNKIAYNLYIKSGFTVVSKNTMFIKMMKKL
jgi:ribosomal protein S18 acetylase RimI-like enzyme